MRAARPGRPHRLRKALVLSCWVVAGTHPAAARPAPVETRSDSVLALPFLPASEPGQTFTASRLTKTYNRDLMQFVRPVRRLPATEIAALDALPPARVAAPDSAVADSSDIRLTRNGQGKRPTELSPTEKAALAPEKPGAHVGIPGPVAATTALLGGFALLVKLISELVR
jgi:hypothetical protein